MQATGDVHVYKILGVSPGHEWVAIEGDCGAAGASGATGGKTGIAGFEVGVLNVELKDGATIINNNGYAYIRDTPEMPRLLAALKPDKLSGNAKWRLHIEYERNRDDHSYYPGPTAAEWKTLPASANWNIVDELGADFRGGKATLYCEYAGILCQMVIHIRGNNPAETTVATEIGDNPWYAKPIAKWESDRPIQGRYYAQFNTVGNLGPNSGDYLSCPNFGAPNGWGIFQLDTPNPIAQQLWSWKANVSGGKARLANPCRTEAQTWITAQETQQQAEEPSMSLDNYIFTFNGVNFRKGTTKTPVDACTIQRYNGAGLWVIYWKNKTETEPGSWQIRGGSYSEYVEHICSEVP